MLVTAFPDGMRFLSEDQQKDTRALYRREMLDLDANECGAAVQRIIRSGKKFPLVAEIREATELIAMGNRSVGLEAWGRVQKAMAREGRNKIPGRDFHFKDPVILQTVEAMGWRYLCDSPDHVQDRARFIEAFDQLKRKAITDNIAGQIPPPIPRAQLHDGPRPLAAIVGDVMPKESQP